MTSPILGAIEGGGTKFLCAVGTAPDTIRDCITVRTTDPGRTLAACIQFLVQAQEKYGPIAALGFGCFGPLDLYWQSTRYGYVMGTPKPGWSNADLLGPLRARFEVPIALDTDVGAAALAEWRLGAPGIGSLAYVTVGTGIGGGVAPRSGKVELLHAEMGHLRVLRDRRDLEFNGICPYHGDCLEGLASGPAIRARWGCNLEELPSNHASWMIIGGYLGQLAAAICLLNPVDRIVFGGGVGNNEGLLPYVRQAARESLNGYLQPLNELGFEQYICAPKLGSRAGIMGALLLAAQAQALESARALTDSRHH